MAKVELVQKTVRIYKPLAKLLRIAAANDTFGEELSQQEILNMALAKFLRVDFRELTVDNEKEDIAKATEAFYSGEDPQPEGEIEDPPKEEFVVAIVDKMITDKWSWNLLQQSIDDNPNRYYLYEKEVRKRVEELGHSFIESNIDRNNGDLQ
jgi:hypothetical protein